MSAVSSFSASLLMPDLPKGPMDRFLSCARDSLAELDATSAPPMVDADGGTARGDTVSIKVTIDPDGDDLGPRVFFEIGLRRDAVPRNSEHAVNVLGDIVMRSLAICDADYIGWLHNDLLLEREEFVELRTYVSPRRTATGRQRIADPVEIDGWDAAEVNLARMFREDPADAPPTDNSRLAAINSLQTRTRARLDVLTDRLRNTPRDELHNQLACWGVTGAMGLIVWPVGLALAANHVLRRPDLRLASQTSALTGLSTSLYATGAFNALILM